MIRKIVCIQMHGEFPDFTHRLVMPDYGLPLIGTLLAKEGYDVRIFIEHVDTDDSIFRGITQLARGDQVDRHMVL